ncbi:hypothetical protein BDB00DRAFT_850577 [Zychaea mexicana]|uniref:uncharacterized protein n=1 Tax=Zychaea mexicana TaxID=64656 RepID=UPI0022FF146D|nr:uncharacterized protein BDB00DRAFT_850577 [Zychaea mexicana]KAI9487996.1 hypothetical protein BDB00DRAFT_850577 [Zychaea mexicana]
MTIFNCRKSSLNAYLWRCTGEEEHSDTDTTRCCCPYKSCTDSHIELYHMYRHIRQKHDAEFPLMKTSEFYYRVFKNIDGKRILFNAASRNLLDAGEKIVIEYPISETPRYYCPYKSCTSSSPKVRYIYWHIRTKHDADLPLLKRNARVFKNKDGKRILFDEDGTTVNSMLTSIFHTCMIHSCI